MSSRFGALYDTGVDAVVHAAFFAALGVGTAKTSGETVWVWLGLVATLGAVINSVISLFREARTVRTANVPEIPGNFRSPRSAGQWFLYVFRELSRSDFCLLVAGLAVLNALWILLPAGAVGAQCLLDYRSASRCRQVSCLGHRPGGHGSSTCW